MPEKPRVGNTCDDGLGCRTNKTRKRNANPRPEGPNFSRRCVAHVSKPANSGACNSARRLRGESDVQPSARARDVERNVVRHVDLEEEGHVDARRARVSTRARSTSICQDVTLFPKSFLEADTASSTGRFVPLLLATFGAINLCLRILREVPLAPEDTDLHGRQGLHLSRNSCTLAKKWVPRPTALGMRSFCFSVTQSQSTATHHPTVGDLGDNSSAQRGSRKMIPSSDAGNNTRVQLRIRLLFTR